jgi:hypothetical protein
MHRVYATSACRAWRPQSFHPNVQETFALCAVAERGSPVTGARSEKPENRLRVGPD